MAVERVFQTSGRLMGENAHQNVDIVSLTERINIPQLLESRMPQQAGECLVEQPVMEDHEIGKMADRVIKLRSGKVASIKTNPNPLHARDLIW